MVTKKWHIRLDVQKQYDNELITMIKQEVYANDLYISLFNNGVKVAFDDITHISVVVDKPDQTQVIGSGEVIKNGLIKYTMDYQAIAALGIATITLKLHTLDSVMATSSFNINVIADPYAGTDGSIESTTEYTVLQDLIDRHTTYVQAENSRVAAELLRADTELNRQGWEEGRNTNEDIRIGNEIDRVTSEGKRVSVELLRVYAESIRGVNELERTTAEGTRKANEFSRTEEESTRVTTEGTREANELERKTAENIRGSNELARIAAEGLRDNAYAQAEIDRDGLYETAEGIRDASFEAAELERDNSLVIHKISNMAQFTALLEDTTQHVKYAMVTDLLLISGTTNIMAAGITNIINGIYLKIAGTCELNIYTDEYMTSEIRTEAIGVSNGGSLTINLGSSNNTDGVYVYTQVIQINQSPCVINKIDTYSAFSVQRVALSNGATITGHDIINWKTLAAPATTLQDGFMSKEDKILLNTVNADLAEYKLNYVDHLTATMPHQFKDLKNDKTYNFGFQLSGEGKPQIIYEEVI